MAVRKRKRTIPFKKCRNQIIMIQMRISSLTSKAVVLLTLSLTIHLEIKMEQTAKLAIQNVVF